VTPVRLTFRMPDPVVPAEAESLDPLYKYEFLVTYSYASFDYKLETTNVAFSLGMNSFERLINPYYFFSALGPAGSVRDYPGGDQTVVVNTVGVSCEQPSYVLLAEYQDYDSTLNPMKTFRADGSYWQTSTNDESHRNAYYMDRIYLAVPELDTPEYTETTLGGGCGGKRNSPISTHRLSRRQLLGNAGNVQDEKQPAECAVDLESRSAGSHPGGGCGKFRNGTSERETGNEPQRVLPDYEKETVRAMIRFKNHAWQGGWMKTPFGRRGKGWEENGNGKGDGIVIPLLLLLLAERPSVPGGRRGTRESGPGRGAEQGRREG